jgi:DNA-binding transcriptional MocR family regulator
VNDTASTFTDSFWAARYAPRMARVRASEIRELLKLIDQPDIISFAGGIPDPGGFPMEKLRAAQAEVAAEGAGSLQYSVSEGYLPLREWIAAQMTADGVPCGPDNIVITAGSQQALDLIGKLFLHPGAEALVEAPSYMGALGAFNAYEPAWRALDWAAPEAGRASLGYFVPDYANPTGRTLTRAQRETLLDLAEAAGMVLVEDGAYREIRFSDQPQPLIQALDVARRGSIEQARTLFCGTFSKTLAPALRMGWVCGPKAVIEKLVLLKQAGDLHVSTVNQKVVARAVSEGFDAHLQMLRGAYRRRAGAMLAALKAEMPQGIRWTEPEGGMFVWLDLPEGFDAAALLERAIAEERVAFVPGAPFFAVDPKPHTLRLSYSLPSEPQMAEGIGRLARLIARG